MARTAPQETSKFHSLSRRIIWRFCVFTLCISAVYGLISLMLLYNLEDQFIQRGVLQEAQFLQSSYAQNGEWPEPRNANMQLIFDANELPEDFLAIALEEPQRTEFYGSQGRHYHLHRFPQHDEVFLVAEVSDQLVVRPIRGGIIQFLVVSGLFIAGIACLIAWFIGRRTTRPLQQLANLVEGVAPDKLPSDFAAHYPRNEVGILAQALEQSLHRIANAISREKSFTRDVSHELRTPLAVIKNAIELLQQQHEDQPALNRILQASEQMEHTVQTLLMLAREEHGRGQQKSTALMPVIERAVLDNRLLLADKPIEVEIADNCEVTINGDENVLKVVLDNLLSNAFRFTDAGTVRLYFSNHELHIEDSGPGIEPALTDSLTDVGVKGQQSTGFGFGLSIVKRLCEFQGWTLTVTSASGTTVTVTFN
ncbi:sensor histidine kinase [Alteromonas flava]|uniref:sensor histidine kinase n=1 Tax=Alteromonas flava TaxID=2048003 RepID=UPI000C28E890|nr:HAMP domain-containing sensor histidine kinase [Alteromonas flava]